MQLGLDALTPLKQALNGPGTRGLQPNDVAIDKPR
jgi:hypothetical protein